MVSSPVHWLEIFHAATDNHSGVCPEPGGELFFTRTKYNGPYNPGSQVTYTCHQKESLTITCEDEGTWTEEKFPHCPGQSEECFRLHCEQ